MDGKRQKNSVHIALVLQILTLLSSLLFALLKQRDTFFLLLIPSVIYILIFHLEAFYRKRKILELAEISERILYSGERLSVAEYREGEIAILAAEIEKLLIRLFEQSEQLKKDKLFLSSSLADISHQLKTPLTSVQLLLEKLRNGADDEAERRRIISEIYFLLEQITRLVDALLKISQIDAGSIRFRKERVSLEKLVKKSLSPLAVRLDLRNIRTCIHLQGFCEADPVWTAEALSNVLKNCAEHTPDGGRLEISGEENPLYSEIIIKDSGRGIAPEDLPHIFERFYKGKNASPYSIGIGLALAPRIMTAQDGTITAENQPDGGAVFTLRFYKSVI